MNISLKFIDETLAGLNDILRQGGGLLLPKPSLSRRSFYTNSFKTSN
ncbi:phage protein [Streptococcus pyogenes]|uniref:Phage protein n=1 Tax=Streptococcus pyogenes TaxID=1314 RepID=A0A8B6IYD8_STRPY|nr:phage protein [Streptococcus pyogenes]VHD02835.1 phage protein [Streptococcus pyogenes]